MEYRFKKYTKTPLMRNHLNLGGENPDGERIDVTSLYFERNQKPWIGVMGEYHFSRDHRENWKRELCKMKAGGITTVSTYMFWIYHEETEGQYDFSGDLDIRSFTKLCAEAGLEMVLRVGPWAHGECRNGGFPDWLLKKPYKLRDNNPAYMSQVEAWYTRIYEQVQGLFYKDGGNIIAVQIENEYVDNAEHLLALKELAKKVGLDAPVYTVTGWNNVSGARIPVNEFVPVFGGYADAPWEPGIEPLPPSKQYYFNSMRNDTAIGVEPDKQVASDGWLLPYRNYPFATCELGGGIHPTHHRRPVISAMDTYALSLVKLGSGNNLAGYYMYHGGTNKIGKLSAFNESKATGYPNDYPILSYDFQAPVSEFGEIREQYRLLNMLHLFIHSFGDILAPMEYTEQEQDIEFGDMAALRYAMRTDGDSGFVFVNHYQRSQKLTDLYEVVINTGTVVFPPVNICGDISFFMPFHMKTGNTILKYATAQPLCVVDGVYFFVEIKGIQPEYVFENESDAPVIVTLPLEQARYARLLSGRLYIGDHCDLYEEDGEIKAAQQGSFSYRMWDGSGFVPAARHAEFHQAVLSMKECSEPFVPEYVEELNIDGERSRTWKKLCVSSGEGFVEINYRGDVAQIYADGRLAADEYYCGTPWRVPAKLLYGKECYLVTSELKNDFCAEQAR